MCSRSTLLGSISSPSCREHVEGLVAGAARLVSCACQVRTHANTHNSVRHMSRHARTPQSGTATTAVARVKVLDAHSDPQIPAATDLRHIILAGGLFVVLASNEGSVEYMPPERRPAAVFPACCSQEEEGHHFWSTAKGSLPPPCIPHRGTVRLYKTEIKLKPHTG